MDIEVNEKIEQLSTIFYFVQVKISMAALMCPAVLITLTNYFVFDRKEKSYILPISIMYVQNATNSNNSYFQRENPIYLFHTFWRLPFDWRTPLGYLLAIVFEIVSFFGVISNVSPSACFAIGSYMWAKHMFVTEIIKNVNDLNALIINSHRRNIRAMQKLFNNILQDFSDIKELSALQFALTLIFK